MKHAFLAIALIVLTAGGTAIASQSSAITGIWSTGSQGGRVQIYQCGSGICGKIIDAAPLRANPDQRDVNNPDKNLRDRRLKGLVVVQGFTGGPPSGKAVPFTTPNPAKAQPKAT